MNKRDTTDHLLNGALLRPVVEGGPISLRRYLPSPALSQWVRHYWFVSWDFPPGQTYVQAVLPLPAVNAVIEEDGAWVYGVWRRRYEKVLEGRGQAWGILFLPTGFYPFWGRSVHQIADRRISFGDAFERSRTETSLQTDEGAVRVNSLVQSLRQGTAREQAARDADAVRNIEAYLATHAVVADEEPVRVWVASIEREPQLTRVEQLAELHGVGVRTLQRQMRSRVGLGPKQLIRRYRLLEAASRLALGQAVSHAHLAQELGYSDQAHFVRDFRAVTGVSPALQERRQRGAGGSFVLAPREPLTGDV